MVSELVDLHFLPLPVRCCQSAPSACRSAGYHGRDWPAVLIGLESEAGPRSVERADWHNCYYCDRHVCDRFYLFDVLGDENEEKKARKNMI